VFTVEVGFGWGRERLRVSCVEWLDQEHAWWNAVFGDLILEDDEILGSRRGCAWGLGRRRCGPRSVAAAAAVGRLQADRRSNVPPD